MCSFSLCISNVDLRIIYLVPLESIIRAGDYLPEVWVSNAGVSELSGTSNNTLSTVEPVPTSTGLSRGSDIQKDQQQQTWAQPHVVTLQSHVTAYNTIILSSDTNITPYQSFLSKNQDHRILKKVLLYYM